MWRQALLVRGKRLSSGVFSFRAGQKRKSVCMRKHSSSFVLETPEKSAKFNPWSRVCARTARVCTRTAHACTRTCVRRVSAEFRKRWFQSNRFAECGDCSSAGKVLPERHIESIVPIVPTLAIRAENRTKEIKPFLLWCGNLHQNHGNLHQNRGILPPLGKKTINVAEEEQDSHSPARAYSEVRVRGSWHSNV